MEHQVLIECDPPKIDLVLNSHHHVDHMHGNKAFHNARIGFHQFSAAAAQEKEVFGPDYVLSLWSRLMHEPLNLEYILGQSGERLLIKDSVLVSFPSSRVDFTFEQDDELDLGKVKLRVLHTPRPLSGALLFLLGKGEACCSRLI